MFASPAKPRGTPRRRPKTPGGTLGAKLRQRVLEVFPSSLPPSSPIPTSSRHPSSDDTEQPIVYSDFGSLVLEENEQEEDDDPFGFFSVERKLRAIRAAQPLPQPQQLETSPARQPMPSTPHKPKLGTVMHASATSSPSPVKRRGDNTPDPESESESDQPPPPPKRSSRKRTRVAEDKDKDKPAKRGKSTMDRDLDSDLPKPPKTRRSARVLASNSKATSKPASTKPKSVVKAKPASKSIKSARKGNGKGKEKENVENVENDDDEEEDAEQRERLARIAYFKKLDDYSFEKENVYVV
ncbi:hypothetical protein C8F01DRAFT_1371406 [Mycena amicta]|nr:hypothetical protein C8F01DRAFT_1371406 [Mycena amicta]